MENALHVYAKCSSSTMPIGCAQRALKRMTVIHCLHPHKVLIYNTSMPRLGSKTAMRVGFAFSFLMCSFAWTFLPHPWAFLHPFLLPSIVLFPISTTTGRHDGIQPPPPQELLGHHLDGGVQVPPMPVGLFPVPLSNTLDRMLSFHGPRASIGSSLSPPGPLGSLHGLFFQGFDASVRIHRYLLIGRPEVSMEGHPDGVCDQGRRASTRSHVRILHVAKGRLQRWRPRVRTWR